MKLAEALILRADLQTRYSQIQQRLIQNAKVQDGEKPAEEPEKLLKEVEAISAELQGLIQHINATNSQTKLDGDISISDAIAVRDILRMNHSLYRQLAGAAVVTQDRYTKSEVKFRSTVNIATLQKQADDLARKHRELDTKIQEANWRTELKA
ncbi:MAG: DIP1984 family protein [Methanoregula sp.]|jgi:hypothetical protein